MTELFVLLLPLAAFSGWWMARSDKKSDKEQKADDYFQGLGYLLEDKTDKAIDIFVRIAHLDDSTIENQITLGNLFRYRGEIDRALHIHSTLASKGKLSSETNQKLFLALADDYRAAGIMNHAETYYIKASEEYQPDLREKSLRSLVTLYAEQAQWEKAIEISEAVDPFKRDSIQQSVAHFYCEIAKKAIAENDTETAQDALKKALACDTKCVRATLKLGRLSAQQGNHVTAISYLQYLEKQNPAFLPEVLHDLAQSYSALNQEHEWKAELGRLSKKYKNPVLSLSYNALIDSTEGSEASQKFLEDGLAQHPNILTLHAYIEQLSQRDDSAPLQLVKASIDRVLGHALKYRCSECGFRGNKLNWQCPGCKQWGTFTPISDLSLKEDIA